MPVFCFFSISCLVSLCLFVSLSPVEIPTRLSNLFYANNFILIFVDVNVDTEYALHNDLDICQIFVNYKVLPTFDFHSMYRFRVVTVTSD